MNFWPFRRRAKDSVSRGDTLALQYMLHLRDVAHAFHNVANNGKRDGRIGPIQSNERLRSRISLANALGGVLHHSSAAQLLAGKIGADGADLTYGDFSDHFAIALKADAGVLAERRDVALKSLDAFKIGHLLCSLLESIIYDLDPVKETRRQDGHG